MLSGQKRAIFCTGLLAGGGLMAYFTDFVFLMLGGLLLAGIGVSIFLYGAIKDAYGGGLKKP